MGCGAGKCAQLPPSQQWGFSLQELLTIVNQPSNKIGNGGFGDVYKGTLKNGNVVAVKKLKKERTMHERQFRNELKILQELEHSNIVRLLGYFKEEKLLCYEYVTKGSLDKYLKDESIGWGDRFKIVKGICWGLCYLHDQRPHDPIVHLDLKPENILLDDTMVPKIADFGISKLFSEDQTRHLTENVVGSMGYMAPEYLKDGEITVKCDIFSFGILMLEIVTGKVVPKDEPVTPIHQYIKQVRSTWYGASQMRARYPSLDDDQLDEVKRCISIGIRCLEVESRNRPTATEINDMLNGIQPLKDNRIFCINKSIVLPARALTLEHSDNIDCWIWRTDDESSSSRQRAYLKEVWYFHIAGTIPTKDLIADAIYKVYLVYKLSRYQSGFASGQSSEIRLNNGGTLLASSKVCVDPAGSIGEANVTSYPRTKGEDGWMELELGEFENSVELQGDNNALVVMLAEKNITVAKKGLIIDGMEFRPHI